MIADRIKNYFPKVNVKVQPRKGSAVLFRNLIGNTRESDPLSLHAGLPPTKNEEKWIINVFIRYTLYFWKWNLFLFDIKKFL